MKRFLNQLKDGVPWPLFVLGIIFSILSLLLKADAGILISGLMVLGSVVVFIYDCVLARAAEQELIRRIECDEARQRASEAKIRRLYSELQAQAKKERESE